MKKSNLKKSTNFDSLEKNMETNKSKASVKSPDRGYGSNYVSAEDLQKELQELKQKLDQVEASNLNIANQQQNTGAKSIKSNTNKSSKASPSRDNMQPLQKTSTLKYTRTATENIQQNYDLDKTSKTSSSKYSQMQYQQVNQPAQDYLNEDNMSNYLEEVEEEQNLDAPNFEIKGDVKFDESFGNQTGEIPPPPLRSSLKDRNNMDAMNFDLDLSSSPVKDKVVNKPSDFDLQISDNVMVNRPDDFDLQVSYNDSYIKSNIPPAPDPSLILGSAPPPPPDFSLVVENKTSGDDD